MRKKPKKRVSKANENAIQRFAAKGLPFIAWLPNSTPVLNLNYAATYDGLNDN
jgi:hypothetical protein